MGNCGCVSKPRKPPGGEVGDNNQNTSNINQTTASYNATDDRVDLNSPQRFTESGGMSSPADVTLQMQDGPHEVTGYKVIHGLYDYDAATPDDLPFKKGDQMEVINDQDGDWWLVKHLTTGKCGYIPSNYVAAHETLETLDWFHKNIGRKDAETMLLSPGYPRGTFLVRERETQPGSYSLSVRDYEESRGNHIKHYKIRELDNGGYFIAAKRRYANLPELIEHYMRNADGLCYKLVRACPKVKPQQWDLSRETKDQWEIPRTSIQLMDKLGGGMFGDVWRGKWNGMTDVAVKTLKPGTMSSELFLGEAAVMKTCQHKHLVTLYAVCSQDEPILIITELMPNGSLLNYLRDDIGSNLPVDVLINMSAQIASGMSFLESGKYIHRDLAARNILVGHGNLVKVADFGLARIIEDDEYNARQGAKFPIKWTAPEAALYGKFTIKSDVWSYGILLIEIITHGQVPYPGMMNAEVLQQLEKGFRHPQPDGCPSPLYDIMLDCWKQNAVARPTFEYLKNTMEDFPVAVEMQYVE
ncbi:Tyrosine-protein kinase Fyn [Lamellibrachia satsuma]|nr:Tyrosine-protein kinase Fyn [Lamellibrachia satsuma]